MFRFTIRDVLWLTALVAMGGAWWADRSELVSGQAYALQMVAAELKREYEHDNPPKKIDITVNGGGITVDRK